ncbi:MAG: hypothetical protein IKO21_02570 [Fibrobacter sp.]|nr:hypothetical protein [Fibrobacter sp.]
MNPKSKKDAYRQQVVEYLIRLYQENHPYSREILTTLVRRFRSDFKRWAARYRCKYYRYRPNIPAKDYEAVIMSCLPRAAQNYDFTANTLFSTYLHAYANYACKNYANENGDFLKVFNKRKNKSKPTSNLNEEQQTEQSTKPNAKQQKDDSDENAAVYALPFEDLTTRDYAAYDAERFYHRNQRQETQRNMELLQCLLDDMKNSSSIVEKKQATRIRAFMNHILMGGSKKSFCDITGTHRATLDASLTAIRKKILQKNIFFRTSFRIGVHNHYAIS